MVFLIITKITHTNSYDFALPKPLLLGIPCFLLLFIRTRANNETVAKIPPASGLRHSLKAARRIKAPGECYLIADLERWLF